MSYHVKRHGIGDAVTSSMSTTSVKPSTVVSTGPAASTTISPASIAAQWAAAVKSTVPTNASMSQGAQATLTAVNAVLPAQIAAQQAECAVYTDPTANAHCMEAAQVLSGPDLARNVQAKLDCDDLILNQGLLTDDQRLDCVDCAYTRDVPKDQLAAAVLQLEVDRAYALGVAQQGFFAKHKIAIFAVGGSVVALGLAAIILRKKHTVQPVKTNRRTRRS